MHVVKNLAGKDCKEILEKLTLSQKEFAELCGVKQSLVSRWEKDGPILEENIVKLGILHEEVMKPKRLKKLKKHLNDEDGPAALAPLLACAVKGSKKGLRAAFAVGALSGAGLFGVGLLALGGAFGTYKLLKSVFEPEGEDSDES